MTNLQYTLFSVFVCPNIKLMIGNTDERNIADAMHLVKPLHVMPYSYFSEGMNLSEGRGHEAIVHAYFK